MPQMYSATFSGLASAAAVDFFELLAPSTKVVVVHSINIGQITDLGDAAEEVLTVQLRRGVGSVTSGSGGSSPTPAKLETGDTAAAATVEISNTTAMVVGSGTITILKFLPWNIRGEFVYLPTPEARIILSPSERLAVGLLAAPADTITSHGTLVWEEIG